MQYFVFDPFSLHIRSFLRKESFPWMLLNSTHLSVCLHFNLSLGICCCSSMKGHFWFRGQSYCPVCVCVGIWCLTCAHHAVSAPPVTPASAVPFHQDHAICTHWCFLANICKYKFIQLSEGNTWSPTGWYMKNIVLLHLKFSTDSIIPWKLIRIIFAKPPTSQNLSTIYSLSSWCTGINTKAPLIKLPLSLLEDLLNIPSCRRIVMLVCPETCYLDVRCFFLRLLYVPVLVQYCSVPLPQYTQGFNHAI